MNDILHLLLMIAIGFLAGFTNTLASSGSAISLPFLMLMGLPATIANGTNRIMLLSGSIAALCAFQKAKAIDWKNGLILSVPVILGTYVGAQIASHISSKNLHMFIVGAVLVALILLFTNIKKLLTDSRSQALNLGGSRLFALFLVGIWAGFIVLDSATYVLLVLVLGVGYDLIRANALKSLFLFFISLTSIAVFANQGEINWYYGIMLALGSIAGAWYGGLLASKEWIKVWIFRMLVVVIGLEVAQMVLKA